MDRTFYVYEWFIVDSLEVFYVGKGTGVRRFETHNRNRWFNNILKKYECAVRIVKQSLTNEEACELEIERIAELKAKGWAKCNLTAGGTGFSPGALNPRFRKPLYGKDNPMIKYKIDFTGEKNHFFGKKHSEFTKRKISISRKGKGARYGEDNPMFGRSDLTSGEKNGMYGRKGFAHPNSKMFLVEYHDGTSETLTYKQCEKKFGIAFMRLNGESGVLHYKKQTPNKTKYEGVKLTRVK
jgi:hypothetical protein